MQFVLTGFTPDKNFRVFAFEGIEADRTRTEFTVRTDLSLILRYGIGLQELPVLCRGLLERCVEGDPQRTLTFTEAEMSIYADRRASDRAEVQRKKALRRPSTPKPTNPVLVPGVIL